MKRFLFLFTLIGFFQNTNGQNNQNIELSKIESGSYSVYKVMEKGYNNYIFQLATKKWPIEFFKEGDHFSKVLVKRVGLIDEFYKVDLPNHPAYFHGGNKEYVVSAINKKIYYYVWSPAKGAKIDYIFSNNGKPSKYANEKVALDTYRKSIKNKQVGAREERKEENAAIAAKEAEENTLKGKSIKSIKLKLIDPPSEIGMFTVVKVGIEVTLTNGKVLKTKNIGGKTPYTDFSSNTKGGDFSGGDFKVANDSRNIPTDKIEIEVWSKYDSKIKADLSHPINYKNDIFYHYTGSSGAHGRGAVVGVSQNGRNGSNGRSVNIRAESRVINGENVSEIVITNASTGEILAEAKINNTHTLYVNTSGGYGGNGCRGSHAHSGNGGNGGDGGDGGDITVTGSAAYTLQLEATTDGGNGGSGGSAKNSYNSKGSNGSNGRNGSLIK